MGFLRNDENKVRFSLSKTARLIVKEDMRIFSIEKEGTIVNLILRNFHETSKATITQYLDRIREHYERIFEGLKIDEKLKNQVIEHLLKKERYEVELCLRQYLSEREESKIYRINNNNFEFLENEFVDNKFYNEKAGLYVKCLIEEYARLPFMKRVRIIKKDIFTMIEDAIELEKLLKVTVKIDNKDVCLEVYPYKILSDPLNTQEYLACYTKKKEESSKEKRVASFTIIRLEKVSRLNQKSFLSKEEIKKIENDIENLTVAFLLGEKKQIHVYLTETGKKFYQSRLHMRPEKDNDNSGDDVYVFNCSELQAYNYFFSFGAEAEIIEPASLRNKLKCAYEDALKRYS